MGTIRFTLREDKTDKVGKHPIELLYQVSGDRKYYSTGEKIFKECWNKEDQKATFTVSKIKKEDRPTKRDIEDVNNNLAKIINHISDIERRAELDRVIYPTEIVIEKLKQLLKPTKTKSENRDLVFNYIDKYIEENKDTREAGSLQVYRSLKMHLKDYQESRGVNITFLKLDSNFFKDFQRFLITPRKKIIAPKNEGQAPKVKVISLNNVSANKQLSTLKTFLNYARSEGIPVSDNYKDFKIKKEKLEVIALTEGEFQKLFNLDLSKDKRLDKVRDVFCFSCATGLRYSDLKKLRWEHIKEDEIRIVVKKTRAELTIPLNPYSVAILTKYTGNHFPLPVISNQRLNEYLKELGKLAGINEEIEIVRYQGKKRIETVYPKYELLTVHVGRKSFVTLSLEKGMTAEEVMKISGHENYESFKRYLNVTEQRKKSAMKKAWGEAKPFVKSTKALKVV